MIQENNAQSWKKISKLMIYCGHITSINAKSCKQIWKKTKEVMNVSLKKCTNYAYNFTNTWF